MTGALVGQFLPGGQTFRARPVDRQGKPVWMLDQLKSLMADADREGRQELIGVLLDYDWMIIASGKMWLRYTDFIPQGPHKVVADVGAGHWGRASLQAQEYQLLSGPPSLARWAYLWDSDGDALRVYAAVHGRWHLVSHLWPSELAGLTGQGARDIQQRGFWLSDRSPQLPSATATTEDPNDRGDSVMTSGNPSGPRGALKVRGRSFTVVWECAGVNGGRYHVHDELTNVRLTPHGLTEQPTRSDIADLLDDLAEAVLLGRTATDWDRAGHQALVEVIVETRTVGRGQHRPGPEEVVRSAEGPATQARVSTEECRTHVPPCSLH